MRVAHLLTAAAAALACPEHAAATTCVFSVVWPTPLLPAPTDTHVWLTLATDWETTGGERWRLALRSAAVTGAPALEVPVLRRGTPGHRETTIELVPRAPLAANTRYEVWMLPGSGARPPRFVSTFKTSAARDPIAPAWSGRVVLQRYFDPARRRGPVDVTEPGERTLWLAADLATDGGDPALPVLFGLWLADDRGVFAYDGPAAAYVRQDPEARRIARPGSTPTQSLRLGGGGAVDCDLSNHAIEAGRRSLRIGVRALDLAGNAGPPSELTVKLQP